MTAWVAVISDGAGHDVVMVVLASLARVRQVLLAAKPALVPMKRVLAVSRAVAVVDAASATEPRALLAVKPVLAVSRAVAVRVPELVTCGRASRAYELAALDRFNAGSVRRMG
jgi:hypothetical protein